MSPEERRGEILDALRRLLVRAAERQTQILVIEDLHWADRSTRDLLAFLARNARDERLLIIGTFRTDELHRRHPLTAWLAEAERQPRVDRIERAGADERFDRSSVNGALVNAAATGDGQPRALHINCGWRARRQRSEVNLVF